MAAESRPYAIDSDQECLRLESQAKLAGMERHFDYFTLAPDAKVLDAGCGSGSMTRLMARRVPRGHVTGLDVNEQYLDFARRAAAHEGVSNVTFTPGDIFKLPFPDDSFDVVWSKYVFQWVNDPGAAVREFRRVTRSGGLVVCCNFDGMLLWNYPEVEALQRDIERVHTSLADPWVGRKMYAMFREAGLTEIRVDFEPDRLFTHVGRIDPERRQNWEQQGRAAMPHIAKILGSDEAAERYVEDVLEYFDREDTCTFCALFFVQGRVP